MFFWRSPSRYFFPFLAFLLNLQMLFALIRTFMVTVMMWLRFVLINHRHMQKHNALLMPIFTTMALNL